MEDSRRKAALCMGLIALVLTIFMGPELLQATNEDVIKEFAHAYFDTSPEAYRNLYPNNKFGKTEDKNYIENKFANIATTEAIESIFEQESYVSHVRRAHIKKVELSVNKMKINIVRHDTWRDIYSIDGYVESVKIEDGTKEQLRFMGQISLVEDEGYPRIDSVLMMIDEAAYYNNYNR